MAAVQAAPPQQDGEVPVEGRTVKALTLLSLKRSYDLFVGDANKQPGLDEESQKLKIACKVRLQCHQLLAAIGCTATGSWMTGKALCP